MLLCIVSFLSGALVLGIVQLLLLLYFVLRLSRNQRHATSQSAYVPVEKQNSPVSHQGIMWVAAVSPQILEKAVAQKAGQQQKSQNDSKIKKDEIKKGLITPIQNYAKLSDGNLVLTSLDGSESFISMEGCDVKAVSGAPTASKKWAKKYPVILQHNTRPLLAGSTICLLYLETSWEKETWCKVLREAARRQQSHNSLYTELKKDFKDYMKPIKDHYPSSMPANIPRSISDGKIEEAVPARKLWKKLLKKTSKGISRESKSIEQNRDALQSKSLVRPPIDLKVHEAAAHSISLQRCSSCSYPSSDKVNRHDALEKLSTDISSCKNPVAADSATNKDAPFLFKVSGDCDQPEKHVTDGVLCWNIFFSRLFFDLYHSSVIVTTLQNQIQKLLSKVETPSYISKLSCTHLDLGKAPPIMDGIRILPFDLSGACGLEADLDYSGGAVLTIETRLNLRDKSLQEKAVDQPLESSLVDAATIGLLRESTDSVDNGPEIVGELDVDQAFQTEEGSITADTRHKSDNNKVSKVLSRKHWVQSVAGWKSMLSHVAEQVSQVPLVLSVRVLSLKGTIQIRINEPPSDRIWVGFASMPILEFASEPSIGEHKFSTGPLIAFIAERIKMLLRETMVLPHFEDFCIPWMISDKDDWLEQSLLPIPWSLPRSNDSAHYEDSHRGGQSNVEQDKRKLHNSFAEGQLPSRKVTPTDNLSLSTVTSASTEEQRPSAQREYCSDLERTLLLGGAKYSETSGSEQDSPSAQHAEKDDCLGGLGSQQALSCYGETSGLLSEADDAGNQKEGRESRRAKMMSLGKRMGEKFEEKKRLMAEKMRERFDP